MDRVRELINARDEDIYPFSGQGITVALLDTGECVIILSLRHKQK